MIQTIDDGFKIQPGTNEKNRFIFDSSRPKLSIEFAKKQGYRSLVINPFYGFSDNDLTSIIPLKDQVEELVVGSDKISYEGLLEFSKLKTLGIPDNGRDVVELSKFPDLEVLACTYSSRLSGLETCNNLKDLTLTSYKSRVKNISDLPVLTSLEGLNLFKTDISSIQGIEKYNSLKKLIVFSAPKLETINSLTGLNLLEEFRVEKCKNIRDYDILGNVSTLKKLIILESGEIKSLVFLKSLKKLEFISFWGTNILDGNLSYCEGIPFVGFDNKKHYSHKVEQFKK